MESSLGCIICNSTDFRIVISSEEFKVLECSKCSLAFTYPKPVLPDYANMDFHSKDKDHNETDLIKLSDLPYDWHQLLIAQVNFVKNNFSKSAKVLEIGCGEGLLLALLQEQEYQDVTGIEPSNYAAKRASRRGIKVINALFDDVVLNEKYDVVILSHVLEHIPDPIQFLNKLTSILSEKGGILLTQTNFKGLIPRFLKDKWYAWVPDQHYWHFTPKSLELLLNKVYFAPIETEFCSLVHPHNFIYKFTRLRPSWQDQTISLFRKKALL